MNLSTNTDYLNTKFTSFNGGEVLALEDFNQLGEYNFIKNDVFSGVD
jgi:hypothetical protein